MVYCIEGFCKICKCSAWAWCFLEIKYFINNINKGVLCRAVLSKAILRYSWRACHIFSIKDFNRLYITFSKIWLKADKRLWLFGSDSSSFLNTGIYYFFYCLSFEWQMQLWTGLLSKIAKGFERVWHAPFKIPTGQVYSPRALFGRGEFISAPTLQGNTMLNANDNDGEFS